MTERLDTYKGMIQIETDLSHLSNEIIEYMNENNLKIFDGSINLSSASENVIIVEQWSDEKSWKDFIDVAINDGQKFLIVNFKKLEKEMVEMLEKDEVDKFSEFIDEIGRISMCWIKNNIMYSYNIATDWMVQYDNYLSDLYYDDEEEMITTKEKVPTEIKSATPDELAEELINFFQSRFPEESRRKMIFQSNLFWESKNIEVYQMSPEIKLKIRKSEQLAREQLEKEYQEKEKEQLEKEKTELPALVSSCVEWAREKGIRRVTKADVVVFLQEKGKEMKYQTEKLLWSMVNVKLKSK